MNDEFNPNNFSQRDLDAIRVAVQGSANIPVEDELNGGYPDHPWEPVMWEPGQIGSDPKRPDYGDGINRGPDMLTQEKFHQAFDVPVLNGESEPLPVDESKYHWDYLYSLVMNPDTKIVSGLPALLKDTQDFLQKLDFTVKIDNMPAIYNIVISQTEPMSKYELQLVGHFLMKRCRERHINYQQINFMGAQRVNETTGEATPLEIEV